MRVTFETECPHCRGRIAHTAYTLEDISSANPIALDVLCECGAKVRLEVTLSMNVRSYERPTTEEPGR